MNLNAERLTHVANLLETKHDQFPETLVKRIRRLMDFAEYSMSNEDDHNVARTFLGVAERLIARE